MRLLQFLHAMGAKTNDPLQKLLFGKRVKESRKVGQKGDEEGEEGER